MHRIIQTIKHHRTLLLERFFQDYLFIHINKTGGSSIERALGGKFQHKTAREKIDELGWAVWQAKFTFTFVRNPWDKMVSQYHYRVRTNKAGMGDHPIAFPDWIRATLVDRTPDHYDNPKMFMPQLEWIVDDSGKTLVDFIGRFENLEGDFARVCERLQRHAQLPHLKKSKRDSYRDYYDEATMTIVRDWFAKDIESFGYQF